MTSRESYSFLPIEYVPVLYEEREGPEPHTNGVISMTMSEWSEHPHTWVDELKINICDTEESRFAQVYHEVMTGVVFISITNLMLCTVPEYLEAGWGGVFDVVEFVCTLSFTVEVLLRTWAASDRCLYFCSTDNICDVIAAAPWYVEQFVRLLVYPTSPLLLVIPHDALPIWFSPIRGEWMATLVQGLRVLRLAKAARRIETVTLVLESIRGSFQGLSVLLTFVCFGTIISATIVYYLERDEPGTRITSIPAACWWSIATITGVGYGDFVPETATGKLAAAMFMVSGLLLTSVSVAIITSSFIEQFQRNQVMMRVQKKTERPQSLHVAPILSRGTSDRAKETDTPSHAVSAPPAVDEEPDSPGASSPMASRDLAPSPPDSPPGSPRGSLVLNGDNVLPLRLGDGTPGSNNVMEKLLQLEADLNEVLVVLETMANRVAEQDTDLTTTRLGALGKDRRFRGRSSQIAAVGLLRNQLKGWFRHAEHVAESVVSKMADLEIQSAAQQERPSRRGSSFQMRPRRQATFG
mmetsp:Transcript_60303/g.111857  ORF Transcript_60303/g.111857 Transcript_60303/m.111857 type:complete len:524 (-) Transcript_60303:194-1765(-)